MTVLDRLLRLPLAPLRRTRRLLDRAIHQALPLDDDIEGHRRRLQTLEAVRQAGILGEQACDRIEDRLLRRLMPTPPTAANPAVTPDRATGTLSTSMPVTESEMAIVADRARQALASLTDEEIETVLAVEAKYDGWLASIQTVELRCVPRSTDILSIYEIDLDRHGQLQAARRTARVWRNQAL